MSSETTASASPEPTAEEAATGCNPEPTYPSAEASPEMGPTKSPLLAFLSFALAPEPMTRLFFVITSYSIHYTKLYDTFLDGMSINQYGIGGANRPVRDIRKNNLVMGSGASANSYNFV